jgi:hypothetical protein
MRPIPCALALPLLALPVFASVDDPRAEYRALLKEIAAEAETYDAEIARLEAAGEDAATYRAEWNPAPAFVDVMAEMASEYAGTDDAIQFLSWIVENDPMTAGDDGLPKAASAAMGTLVSDHAANEEFASYIRFAGYRVYLWGKPRSLAMMGAVIEAAPGTELAGDAHFSRAFARMEGGDTSSEERAACNADLVAARELASEERTTDIKGAFFELENLQIGQVAPDIAGADLDGVDFKLSDYRGKVVMIDFWGDW